MKHNYEGLSKPEVEESRKKFGSNDLSPPVIESFWDKLLKNFKNPIIIMLNVALVAIFILSLFNLTAWYEAVAIAVAVALATLISTFSEFKNENSFQKLQEEAARIENNVFREGHLANVLVGDIVTGDFVLLQPGDKIPADGKLIDGNIKVNQASLTGESEGVLKSKIQDDHVSETPDLASSYYLFRGTVVEDGEAVMLVETVGDNSFYGKLSKELSRVEDRLSPLQVKLDDLARFISKYGYTAAIVIAVTFMFDKAVVQNGFDGDKILFYFSSWEYFIPDIVDAIVLSIIIVVAAIPEGLPTMIAIVLSLNMRKLLAEKVLVRKLLGIETAGSLNILFTDKTGTITKGKLKPKLFISGNITTYSKYASIPDSLRALLSLSILENSSSYISDEGEVIGGNVSERALISFIKKEDFDIVAKLQVELQQKILFNSQRKFSASQIVAGISINGILKNSHVTLVKGAPEIILAQCNRYFDDNGKLIELRDKINLINEIDRLADTGIRLIALSITEDPIKEDESLPGNSTLVGIVGISDEIREESAWSIEEVQRAGIQVVMITGDRRGTAAAIADEVGLLNDEKDIILVSSELKKHTDDELKKMLPDMKVIARALPTDKSRLVRISKSLGKVVGMTGDGVNDSAALKQADVGIAMGSGSEVSKEACDIVILDDNFHSISNAIRYGRTIFKSIRKFIVFQLTINVAAVSIVFMGPLIGINFPLTIIQLLWINIIMDTLGAIAFGGEPALIRYMDEPPIDREENILTKYMNSSILTGGIFIMAFSLFFLIFEPFKVLFVRNGVLDANVHITAFFNLFIFMIILNGFNVRTEKLNLLDHLEENKSFIAVIGLIFVLQIFFTYIGGEVLRTTPLEFGEWTIVFGLSLLIIPVDLLRKLIWRYFAKSSESL